jgi:predicted adenylyl cyclase CyaB
VEGFSFQRFRVRQSGDKTVVTAKERVLGDGAEASREHEFEVSDGERFIAFMKLFGFREMLAKRKRGRRWRVAPERAGSCPALVELVEIVDLGWFLEIEVMVEAEKEMAGARARVAELFARLEVPPQDIVTTPYTLMLYEQRQMRGLRR